LEEDSATGRTQNNTEYEKVKLITWPLKQTALEKATYKFNTILLGINIVYYFRSRIGNATEAEHHITAEFLSHA
jgi:hypothetical protein